jgi:hypothetical protein
MREETTPEIEFAGGVRVRLVELHQVETYDGLLEGVPRTRTNARHVDAIREAHPGICVLPPVETPLPSSPTSRVHPFGLPARLPSVQCVARFEANEVGSAYREGRFAWFQPTWALPIDAAVLEAFRHLDWTSCSTRHER